MRRGEINQWRDDLLEVRCYEFDEPSYQLVLSADMLGELAVFVRSAVNSMGRELQAAFAPAVGGRWRR